MTGEEGPPAQPEQPRSGDDRDMSNERSTAHQRSDKSPSRAKLELRRHHKLLRRTHSARGASVPARLSSSPEDEEERRSSSPRGSPPRRPESLIHGYSHDARLPRAQHRRRAERRCTSEISANRSSPRSPMRTVSPLHKVNDAMKHVCQIIIALDGEDGERKADTFENANLDPPITRHSLSELDVGSINTNSKLRHDINYDRELHFRPNLDGAKGRVKRKAQADYWLALVVELELYTAVLIDPSLLVHPTISSDTMQSVCSRRIPNMFEAAKAILKALVPEHDHSSIDQHLDVSMIMQEVRAGVCDLLRIARWLAQTLKAHCAPMRDHTLDKMVKYIARGVAENNTKYLVEGLIQMFGAMEAMKLDVANHQIRQSRMVLIDDTIAFEQQYHLDRIARGRVDVHRARSWYRTYYSPVWRGDQHYEPGLESRPPTSSHTNHFVDALLDTLLSPVCASFPDTFKLDAERLRVIRSDIYDMFCLDACESALLQLAGRRHLSKPNRESFRSLVSTIINQSPHGSSWEDNIENIAAETVRHLAAIVDRADAAFAPPQHAHLRERTEHLLRQIFSDPSRSFFLLKAEATRRQLLPGILCDLDKHLRTPLTEVFNTFLPSIKVLSQHGFPSTQPQGTNPALMDVSRRITHLAILHWRVWAPIVYLNGPEPVASPERQSVVPHITRSAPSRESPAPPQFLADNDPDNDHTEAAASSTNAHVEVAATDVAEQTPRTIANSDAHPPVDDPSSPMLYRQRTT